MAVGWRRFRKGIGHADMWALKIITKISGSPVDLPPVRGGWPLKIFAGETCRFFLCHQLPFLILLIISVVITEKP
jgi:hypothetical protein